MHTHLRIGILVLFTGIGHSLLAQWKVELEAGGSNFLGASTNIAYDISVSADNQHVITPSIGVGVVSSYWWGSTGLITRAGLSYGYKRFGGGVEASVFHKVQTIAPYDRNKEMIIYPHISYKVIDRERLYFQVSAGAYFNYSIYNQPFESNEYMFNFSGDVIPGAGINIGWKFGK